MPAEVVNALNYQETHDLLEKLALADVHSVTIETDLCICTMTPAEAIEAFWELSPGEAFTITEWEN